MTTGAKKYPDFFKVYLPEQTSERMLIPNAWVHLTHLQGRIPENVILRNGSGRVWHVKTRPIRNKLYFDEGWKIFQEENYLRKADFLVFKYDGSNEFKVLILEISTQCEKTVVKMEEEEENVEEPVAAQEVEETEITEEEQDEQNGEDCVKEDEEDSEDEDYDDDDKDSDFDDDIDSDDYTETEEEIEVEYSAGNMGRSFLRACKRETTSSFMPKASNLLEGNYEYDPKMYIQADNPFFEAKVYRSRRNELHIPKNAIIDFSLTFPEKITLLCCQCQDIQRNQLQDYHLSFADQEPIRIKYLEVIGEVCKWQDGRVFIKGWLSFCKRNKMKENDVCLCEIISGEDQIVRMFRVHVLAGRRG